MKCDICKFKTTNNLASEYCSMGHWSNVHGPLIDTVDVETCPNFEEKIYKTLEQLRASSKPKHKVVEQTPEAKEYFQRIREIDAQEKDFSLKGLLDSHYRSNAQHKNDFMPYPISLQDANELYKHIYESEVLKLKDKVQPVNQELIILLVAYFIGADGALSPNKGIYLFGDVGRGKTLIMRCFQRFCKIIEERLTNAGEKFTPRSFKMESCKSIVLKVAEDKNVESLKRFYIDSWCLDDIGAEENYKLFGNEMNVMLDIIVERYQRLQSRKLITHATSNMPFTESRLTSRYDMRFESRCCEMFHPIFFDGIDFRKI